MDPNQTYLDISDAMREGDYETARSLTLVLKRWFASGGFYPNQLTPEAMNAYIAHVLRRTVYLAWPRPQSRKVFPMFYVICPTCQARVEIPADAVGPDRSDPWNVAACIDCSLTFDYNDHEVIGQEQPTG